MCGAHTALPNRSHVPCMRLLALFFFLRDLSKASAVPVIEHRGEFKLLYNYTITRGKHTWQRNKCKILAPGVTFYTPTPGRRLFIHNFAADVCSSTPVTTACRPNRRNHSQTYQ